jgi:hypothetical protein
VVDVRSVDWMLMPTHVYLVYMYVCVLIVGFRLIRVLCGLLDEGNQTLHPMALTSVAAGGSAESGAGVPVSDVLRNHALSLVLDLMEYWHQLALSDDDEEVIRSSLSTRIFISGMSLNCDAIS